MPPSNPSPDSPDSRQPLRLNKFLAERLGISRREADNLIAEGKVFVDDEPVELGARFFPEQEVRVGKKVIEFKQEYIYLAMNKPVGYVCSKKRQGETPTIYELLPEKYRKLKTVGRLDKDSSGLILLTNDGDFSFQMTHPKFFKLKQYEVELDKNLEPLHQQMINDFGVQLEDGVSKLGLTRLNEKPEERRKFLVEMSEGRNRQIRRTFSAIGYTVVKLHRISFGSYRLGELMSKEFRELSF